MPDQDLLAAARAFLDTAAHTPVVDIEVRHGWTMYESMLRAAPELVQRLLARIGELDRERVEARRMHDESPGECYHCPRCQDADESEQDALRARIAELEAWKANAETALAWDKQYIADLQGTCKDWDTRFRALEARIERVLETARGWAEQGTDYDEDTEQQIEDGRALLALLGADAKGKHDA